MPAELYHYTESGLDNVWLDGGVTVRRTPRGEVVSVRNIDGLHEAIGRNLVEERKHLSGREFRFLRHEVGLSQAALARLLGVSEQAVARWEKGRSKLPVAADGTLRLLYKEKISGNVEVQATLHHLAEIDDQASRRLSFVETDGGWDLAA